MDQSLFKQTSQTTLSTHAKSASYSTLPDDYIVFDQLRIPWRDASVELDHVVVCPNCIFNVEFKHWVGEISGSDTDGVWIQRKRQNRN